MIEQIDPSDSSVMATFESVQDAAAAVNGSKGGVSRRLRESARLIRATAGGGRGRKPGQNCRLTARNWPPC